MERLCFAFFGYVKSAVFGYDQPLEKAIMLAWDVAQQNRAKLDGDRKEPANALQKAAADEPALCLQCDMNDCYSRLRRLVPTIPPNKKVSKVEILQHVIDYILDLQLALETHPALLRQPPPPAPPHHPAGTCPAAPPRTPLTALNTDPAGAVNKQGDSILCR
ncbi:DNA-binding protein inhibitor ID-4 [Orycteropus afer afer]|uniref:DNA-binding protein inhibitor ID-4 n=1 Tax=Orycteropus afer afer TaxID=1230840 RepID=A0A8B7AQE5_ORYAF|nr:DNA-binding protein inhibitor ID-4 [Orycteropus afer afer]